MEEKVPFLSADERKADAVDIESLSESQDQQTSRTPLRIAIVTFALLILPITLLTDFPRLVRSIPSLRCHSGHHQHHHSQGYGSPHQPRPEIRPSDISMCDYYAHKKFNGNTAITQKLLVQSIIDKAFVGAKNPDAYFERNFGTKSGMYNGILRAGDMWEVPTDLRKYFDGSLNSTNVNGKATQVNFFSRSTFSLYGRDYPFGNELFDHMKISMGSYIAPMLGCSLYGNTVDRYTGTRSLSEIHKFMDIGKNFEWAYFINQLGLGAWIGGQFSVADTNMFELYLVDKFGPKIIDRATKKVSAPFSNPELEASILPPKLDEERLRAAINNQDSLMEDARSVYTGKIFSKYEKRDNNGGLKPFFFNENRKRVENPPTRVKRQDFTNTPPPLTTPVLAPTNTNKPAATATHESNSSVPSNILPIALGAGIGAGLGVIIIGVVIAYLVIRKKRIQKRQSMPQMTLKSGIEMKKDGTSRRVDRSEHGNVVGKPKDYDQRKMEDQEELEPPMRMGHKKSESVGVRSVRFSQHEA